MSTPTFLRTPGFGWKNTIALALSLWLGGTLLLDLVVMPTMFASGMMLEPGFASAGYLLFHNFNRVEVLFAALTLTGLLAWNYSAHLHLLESKTTLIFTVLLFVIPFICLYGLSPWISSMSLSLDLFDGAQIPTEMFPLQGCYWFLESLKLAAIVAILGVCYRTTA
ncbi:MAG: hypothetical protein ACO31I_15275 [Prochlorotrichaceae cyanobacterium]|jgi:hypothetical protein